jgi:4-hydroxybenzoate polyprenyltransferase
MLVWRRASDFLLYDNWLIAAAALALTLNTSIILGFPITAKPYHFIVFFATLFIYCMHRLLSLIRKDAGESARCNWAKQHKKIMEITTVVAFVVLTVAILYARQRIDLFLIPFAFVTIGYSIPIVRKNAIMLRLRDLPWAKTFLVAIVWSAVTVFLPIIYNAQPLIINKTACLLFLARFLFMMGLTIPFDIRDREQDAKSGVHSIVVLLGEKRAKHLALLCVLGYVILNTLNFAENRNVCIALLLSALWAGYLVKKTSPASTEYHYLLWIDGAMLVEFFLLCAFTA